MAHGSAQREQSRTAPPHSENPRILPAQREKPRAYHVNEFCRLYGIGRSGVYKLLKEGKLPSVVIAGRRVIPSDAGEALLRGEA